MTGIKLIGFKFEVQSARAAGPQASQYSRRACLAGFFIVFLYSFAISGVDTGVLPNLPLGVIFIMRLA